MDVEHDNKLSRLLEAKAEELETRMEKRSSFTECGICSDCRNLVASHTKFGKILAKCFETYQILNSSDPIIECTRFNKMGFLSMYDMKEMATLIEIKKPLGFLSEDLKGE
jgi:hypothetical protein